MQTEEHTLLKSCRKAEAYHIMQIAVACSDVLGIRTEMKRGDRGEQVTKGREREGWSNGTGRGDGGHEFQKLLCS